MRVGKIRKEIVIFIVGPTAMGKTRLAIRLAKRIRGEIVSCDSMQVYKGMNILSQAPSGKERKEARHHLTGILDPRKEYSAASFRKSATGIVKSIIKNKKVPIVVGGSGLYMKALVDGLFPSPAADMKFRKKMAVAASRHGSERLYKRLLKIDPEAAATIHPNDLRRVIRALEIFNTSGRTMTELKAMTKGLKDIYDIKIFGLKAPRQKIYSRIDSRVDEMFADSVVTEVRKLSRRKLSKTAGAVLGFREIAGYLGGEYDIERAKDLMKANTRRFAKRQMTWFRADNRIRWFDVTRNSAIKIVNKIMEEVC